MLCAQNRDSLWHVYADTTVIDTQRLRSLHFLARSYINNNPDSALYYAQIQESLAQKVHNERWLAFAWNTQGSALTVKGDFRTALDKFTRMLELRMAKGDTIGISTAYNNIGNVYYYLGDYPRALDYFILSQRYEQESGQLKGAAISILNIGSLYAQLDQKNQAIRYFKHADSLATTLGDTALKGSCYANLSAAYRDLDSLEVALQYFEQAIPLLESAQDDHSLAILYSNVSDVYRIQGRYEDMFDALNKSYTIRKALGDEQGIARMHISLGSAYLLTGKPKTARAECLLGLQLAEPLEAMPEIKDACTCLYSTFKELNENEIALKYYERANAIDKEMAQTETQRQLQIMEFRRQVAADSIAREREKESIAQLHADEIRKESNERTFLLFSGIILLLSSIVLFLFFRRANKSKKRIEEEKSRADTLLLNILPAPVTKELLEKGRVDAREFEHVTVLFTDFIGFTTTSRQMPPQELLQELNTVFRHFDEIVSRRDISKIKSIGDAYMAAGGLPVSSVDTVKQTVLAALEMQDYVEKRFAERQQTGQLGFQMRVGIHHGPVIAGIVGFHNFQYDIWGDTVNIASRVEKSGAKGRVSISKDTYMHIADDPTFRFVSRGAIDVKGKGNIEMWFVEKAADH